MERIELRVVQQPEKNGIEEYHLDLNNKHLHLSVNRLTHFAETEIHTTDGEPEKGTTTLLYQRAKELLQNEAQHFGPIQYQISTGFPSMREWTLSYGDSIFHWESAYRAIDDPEKLIVSTTIIA